MVILSAALVGGLAASLLRGKRQRERGLAVAQKGFFGIVQGIRLDQNDFQTMRATGVGTDRFLVFWE